MYFTTCNATAERSTISPIPNATATTCNDTPAALPATVARVARRPAVSARLMVNSTDGPGNATMTTTVTANAATLLNGTTPCTLTRAAPSSFRDHDDRHPAEQDHHHRAGDPPPDVPAVLDLVERRDVDMRTLAGTDQLVIDDDGTCRCQGSRELETALFLARVLIERVNLSSSGGKVHAALVRCRRSLDRPGAGVPQLLPGLQVVGVGLVRGGTSDEDGAVVNHRRPRAVVRRFLPGAKRVLPFDVTT